MRLKDTSIFLRSPGPGTVVWSSAAYTRAAGPEMTAIRMQEFRDDIHENLERSFSVDNGRTWSAWEPIPCVFPDPNGTRRRVAWLGFADPGTDRFIGFALEGVLPNDVASDGMKAWFLRYSVSLDGGHTTVVDEQIIQNGAGYSPEHPVDGVWIGKNSIADPQEPLRSRAGKILVPTQITPLGPDGEYDNPLGTTSFHESCVLIGSWTDGNRISWELSERVKIDVERSTRGAVEPNIVEMPDGRILMVIRGSNQKRPGLPGYKWYAVSHDGGYHWSEPAPWTYADGAHFYSSSGISRCLQHSNGRRYWVGNIHESNPDGNAPRYPLIIGEIDPSSLLLRRETVFRIDDRRPDEDTGVQLSNFRLYEDRETGDIVIFMTRFLPAGWTGDVYTYRLAP